MDTGPNLEAKPRDAVADCAPADDRATRPVEGGEEPVARIIELLAAVAHQLRSNEPLIALQRVSPHAVSDLNGAISRTDDVGHENGREYALALDAGLGA